MGEARPNAGRLAPSDRFPVYRTVPCQHARIALAGCPHEHSSESPCELALAEARRLYDLAVRRVDALGSICSDPAWNMLLDLFVSGAAGRRLSVGDLCIGSLAPTATAIRYIGQLAAAGLVARAADERDARRCFVELTDRGATLLLGVLDPEHHVSRR